MEKILVLIMSLTELALAIEPMTHLSSHPVKTEKMTTKDLFHLERTADATATAMIIQNCTSSLTSKGPRAVAQTDTAATAAGVVEPSTSIANSTSIDHIKLLFQVDSARTEKQTTAAKHSILFSVASHANILSSDYGFHPLVLPTSTKVFSVQSKTELLSKSPYLNVAPMKASDAATITSTVKPNLEAALAITRYLGGVESPSTGTKFIALTVIPTLQRRLLTSKHMPHLQMNSQARNLPYIENILRSISPSLEVTASSINLHPTPQTTANVTGSTETVAPDVTPSSAMADTITGLVIGSIILVLVLVVVIKKVRKHYTRHQRRQPQRPEMEMHFLNQYDAFPL